MKIHIHGGVISYKFINMLRKYLIDRFEEKINVQIYDDYLNQKFIHEGYFYYPLSLRNENEQPLIHWLRWKIYNYDIGLVFNDIREIEDGELNVPNEFRTAMKGRSIWYNKDCFFPFYNMYEAECYSEWSNGFPKGSNRWKYSPSIHLQVQLLDDMAEQITRYILNHSPDKDLLKREFRFELFPQTLIFPIFSQKDYKWYFPIKFVNSQAVAMSIWVSSNSQLHAMLDSISIEVCDKIDPTLIDEWHNGRGDIPWYNYKNYIENELIRFINASPNTRRIITYEKL